MIELASKTPTIIPETNPPQAPKTPCSAPATEPIRAPIIAINITANGMRLLSSFKKTALATSAVSFVLSESSFSFPTLKKKATIGQYITKIRAASDVVIFFKNKTHS